MLLEFLGKIPDHRRAQGRMYKLCDILLVTILGILSGSRSYRDLERFARERLGLLKKHFHIDWKRAPSKSNIMKIFCNLKADDLEGAFREHGAYLLQNTGNTRQTLAIDGKSLRGSFDGLKDQKIAHILSVFSTCNLLVLGHVEIPEKTNEIPTAQGLIKELNFPEGTIFTLDAMHCQKNI